MKRFRFTLLAVCLVLLFLGWNDTSLFLRNRAPQAVTIAALEAGETPREWLRVTGGVLDLSGAISTSGSIELDALLIPLKSDPASSGYRVLVECRDPALLDLFATYHFKLDSDAAKEQFLAEHRSEFLPRRDVTGTRIGGLIASGNRDKLMTLTRELGAPAADNVMFIAEGKEPPSVRGFFFLIVGLLGLGKVLLKWPKPGAPAAAIQS